MVSWTRALLHIMLKNEKSDGIRGRVGVDEGQKHPIPM